MLLDGGDEIDEVASVALMVMRIEVLVRGCNLVRVLLSSQCIDLVTGTHQKTKMDEEAESRSRCDDDSVCIPSQPSPFFLPNHSLPLTRLKFGKLCPDLTRVSRVLPSINSSEISSDVHVRGMRRWHTTLKALRCRKFRVRPSWPRYSSTKSYTESITIPCHSNGNITLE